jgi:DtxR family transcriptional regulator, Mn-dependent transcriptional regulator
MSDATASMQDYLAEAYRLAYYQAENTHVTTSDLAAVLGVSAPAVTRMVQRLRDAGYLEHEPYRGIVLTKSGQHEALINIRRHRIVERFLVDVMRFGWHEVHEVADRMGANVSDAVVARMEQMLNYPRRCPHGEPIPNADGVMPLVEDVLLTAAQVGQSYAISRVRSHDAEMLHYLDSLGVVPGALVTVVQRAPFSGPLQLQVQNQEATAFIGHELAQAVRVCAPKQFALN